MTTVIDRLPKKQTDQKSLSDEKIWNTCLGISFSLGIIFTLIFFFAQFYKWGVTGFENLAILEHKEVESLRKASGYGDKIKILNYSVIWTKFVIANLLLLLVVGRIIFLIYRNRIFRSNTRYIKEALNWAGTFLLMFFSLFFLRQLGVRDSLLKAGQRYCYPTLDSEMNKSLSIPNEGGPLGEPDFEGVFFVLAVLIISVRIGMDLRRNGIPVASNIFARSLVNTGVAMLPLIFGFLLFTIGESIFSDSMWAVFLDRSIPDYVFSFGLPHPKRLILYLLLALILSLLFLTVLSVKSKDKYIK